MRRIGRTGRLEWAEVKRREEVASDICVAQLQRGSGKKAEDRVGMEWGMIKKVNLRSPKKAI